MIDVGPGQTYAALSEVAASLEPGDIVQIHGGNTYREDVILGVSGSDDAKIIIRGVPVDGQRPVLSGSVSVNGDHVELEGLEIRDGDPVCLRHGAHDLTVRDTVVHDCPSHGILGTDIGSGSLTLERVEVYDCATVQTDNTKHQVYIATDEVAHPGSVFRMQSSYVHDAGSGGSNIKSRAERTELYSNWIENAGLFELELYGPDEDAVPSGWSEDLAREDSDVVGNVFYRTRHQGTSFLFRIGGDGSSELGDEGLNDSKGRVRFAYNTVIAPADAGIFRTFNRVESIEAHNNVFYADGGGMRMIEDDAMWIGQTQLVTGDRNWMNEGTMNVPAGWTSTLTAADPQLTNLIDELSPREDSMLVDAGITPTTSPAGHEFPSPLQVPLFHPPLRAVDATLRPTSGALDIGAFEHGDSPPVSANPSAPARAEAASSCRLSREPSPAGWLLLASAVLLLRSARRQSRR